jgi:pilus assembly protein CpaF
MGLYDRLTKNGADDQSTAAGRPDEPPPATTPTPAEPSPHAGANGKRTVVTRQGERNRNAELRERLHAHLLSELAPDAQTVEADPAFLEERVVEELNKALRAEGIPLSAADRDLLIEETLDDVLRLGPIQGLLEDETITEVMVNAPDAVYVEVGGRLLLTDVTFRDANHVRQTIDRIVSRVGRRIDESSPYVDARLPDGSRVNAVVPPISIDSPTLTIRKFSDQALTVEKLLDLGSFTPGARSFLTAAVAGRMNVIVSGGTGAGKTTTLNALSSFIPEDERIITIEDAAELKLQQPHVIRMEYRPPNIEGKGEVTIRDLVRNALRMRPDRIIVGEVRGGEALDMLQAMNTGHDGSISTVHANSPRDVLSRLETMVLMSGVDLPLRAIREQIASAVQLVVHQSRLADGSRRFTHISEITGMEGDTITMQDIFLFDFRAGRDEEGRFVGDLRPTGLRPKLIERLRDVGIEVPTELFDDGRAIDAGKGW